MPDVKPVSEESNGIVHPVSIRDNSLPEKSPVSDIETEVRLTNKLDRSIDLVWLDFKGNPKVYFKDVKAGATVK